MQIGLKSVCAELSWNVVTWKITSSGWYLLIQSYVLVQERHNQFITRTCWCLYRMVYMHMHPCAPTSVIIPPVHEPPNNKLVSNVQFCCKVGVLLATKPCQSTGQPWRMARLENLQQPLRQIRTTQPKVPLWVSHSQSINRTRHTHPIAVPVRVPPCQRQHHLVGARSAPPPVTGQTGEGSRRDTKTTWTDHIYIRLLTYQKVMVRTHCVVGIRPH